jgi:Oxidoreductase family, NAD-binding Rossmann fold
MTNPIRFGLVGTGWRAEFFLRIAKMRPDLFQVAGLVGNTRSKTEALASRFSVPVFDDIKSLCSNGRPAFVVTSVTWAAAPQVLAELVGFNMPVLSETPPAPNTAALYDLWRSIGASAPVQIAEQYAFQPHHTARLNLVYSGRLGEVSQAQVSVAHGYHGINLMRRYLGVGAEACTITARRIGFAQVDGATRTGPPTQETSRQITQTLAWFDWGSRLGVFDFTDQYFSYIRDQRLLVRGSRGELFNDSAVYLKDHVTPIRVYFERHEGGAQGNLEGKYLKGIQCGEDWLYRNLYAPATMSDDEIAIATCLSLMGDYATTGQPFYGLAEACEETYLSFLLDKAVAEGTPQTTDPARPWR